MSLENIVSEREKGAINQQIEEIVRIDNIHQSSIVINNLHVYYESFLYETPRFLFESSEKYQLDGKDIFFLSNNSPNKGARDILKMMIRNELLTIYEKRKNLRFQSINEVPRVIKEITSRSFPNPPSNFGESTDLMGYNDGLYLICLSLGFIRSLHGKSDLLEKAEEHLIYCLSEMATGTCNTGIVVRFYRFIEMMCNLQLNFCPTPHYATYYINLFLNVPVPENSLQFIHLSDGQAPDLQFLRKVRELIESIKITNKEIYDLPIDQLIRIFTLQIPHIENHHSSTIALLYLASLNNESLHLANRNRNIILFTCIPILHIMSKICSG